VKRADFGIDGRLYIADRRQRGYVVAFGFTPHAEIKARRAAQRDGLEITLVTVDEILRDEHALYGEPCDGRQATGHCIAAARAPGPVWLVLHLHLVVGGVWRHAAPRLGVWGSQQPRQRVRAYPKQASCQQAIDRTIRRLLQHGYRLR
jgi:hypothetical protein